MISLILAGLTAGIISGMGIGGGLLLIPVLTLVLGYGQKMAQGINLLYFIPTGMVALYVHYKNKAIDVRLAIKLASYGIIGAIIGSILVGILPADILRRLFAIFIMIMGLFEFYLGYKSERNFQT